MDEEKPGGIFTKKLYAQDGSYLGPAELKIDSGYDTATEGRRIEKERREHTRKVREAEKALGLIDAKELARRQPRLVAPMVPEPGVVRPIRHAGQTAAALKPRTQARICW